MFSSIKYTLCKLKIEHELMTSCLTDECDTIGYIRCIIGNQEYMLTYDEWDEDQMVYISKLNEFETSKISIHDLYDFLKGLAT